MRGCLSGLWSAGALAVTGAIVVSISAGTSAQSPTPAKPTPAGATYRAPRTADGHPDLQGTFDAATMTPIERPAQYAGRLVLTPAEAEAMEKQQAERTEKGSEPSQADRTAPPVGGDRTPTTSYLEGVFRAGGGAVGGYNLFWISPGTQLTVVDGGKRSSIVIDPPNGRIPTMKPEARTRNARLLASRVSPDAAESGAAGPPGAYDGPESRPLAERCLLGFSSTSGPPTLPNYWYNNMKQIVQTKDSVMILNEMVHDARIIRIGGTHVPASVRKWNGDSIGHWEGDTLVVETTNFTDKTQFQGSGPDLKVTERFTRTGEKSLLYRFTVEDSTTWSQPWTGEYSWVATDDHIYEYACHEGNHSLEGVLRGARAGEKK